MLAERLTANMVAGPRARDPAEVAERLLAIQGQDARGARLAIRARSEGLSASDVERAMTEERSLLITWLNRGTLHLVRSEDYHWLHALTTPQLVTSNARRLAQEGVTPAAAKRGVAVIERTLAEEGPQTRATLRDRLAAVRVPVAGQALVHVLMLATLRGVAVRGPMVGRQHAYALVRDWLGKAPTVDRGVALAELARRYLRGHGPSDERDLARWAGINLGDSRAGLAAIASELRERPDGLVDLAKRPRTAKLPPPRLLGAFDPLLLGWRDREPLLAGHEEAVVSGGIFRPLALVRGQAAGTWSLPQGKVELEPFAKLSRAATAALEAEAGDVVRFLAN